MRCELEVESSMMRPRGTRRFLYSKLRSSNSIPLFSLILSAFRKLFGFDSVMLRKTAMLTYYLH